MFTTDFSETKLETIVSDVPEVNNFDWMTSEITPPPMAGIVTEMDVFFPPTFITASVDCRSFSTSVDMSDHPLPPSAR